MERLSDRLKTLLRWQRIKEFWGFRQVSSVILAGLFSASLFLGSCSDEATNAPPEARKAYPKNYKGPVKLGIDMLEEMDFPELEGKRVGLITNQTSVNRAAQKTRLILHRSPKVNLVALFTPEHGLEGTEKAGEHIATRTDPITGLTAHSLYGPTRKPTAQQLANIDVLIFDLQDIGARSYTYISTMVLAMEACGELGKTFVVLDRPNPLGGHRVQGPPMEEKWRSFVGQIPISYVHGMTAGELARMTNEKGWIGAKCDLRVVPMLGWKRSMVWDQTGLRWIASSPNIPNSRSPFYYVATGIFGELKIGDIGIGTTGPFEYAGGRNIDATRFVKALQRANTPGVSFQTYTNPKLPEFSGAKIKITPSTNTDLPALNVLLIHELGLPVEKLFASADANPWKTFYKVYGSTDLKSQMTEGATPQEIIQGWKPFNDHFREERKPYLLY
tara:strand:+ start:2720 stop:4054 length:1335 start_codon:yes stop_codon:yes gene_type:complete